MAQSFQPSLYFYDLETSGIQPRADRVMQFAGQRTDLDLNPIGEPDNILIALPEDVLPDPYAILITGITPQHTQAEGTTEADFLKTFHSEIAVPGTIFVGYNTIRFDDEFMRSINYRNFYDPYQWQWKDGRSRWDLLDVVRMTRALRPEGIKWPVDKEGKATNRLELLTKENGLEHSHAHDALSDVYATIELAKLLNKYQPKLFSYLLRNRTKDAVKEIVNSGQPFVYSSGKYPGEFEKTAVVVKLAENPRGDGALVYDLRHNPEKFKDYSTQELVEAWKWQKPEDRDPNKPRLPIKTIKYNRCPAIAPLGVIASDEQAQKRIGITMELVNQNLAKLKKVEVWPERVLDALQIMDGQLDQYYAQQTLHVDDQIYEGFISNGDSLVMEQIRNAQPDQIASFIPKCKDKRLRELLPLYKARNFPRKLTDTERQVWEEFKHKQLIDGGQKSKLAQYFAKIEEISKRPGLTVEQKYLIEDLNLYGQSFLPSED